jgi:hypothetical protein
MSNYSRGPINSFHKLIIYIYIYIYIYGFKKIVIINKIIELFRLLIMPLLFIKCIINYIIIWSIKIPPSTRRVRGKLRRRFDLRPKSLFF